MRKPLSFKAIEFLVYLQIGFVFGLIAGYISFVVLSLITYGLINYESTLSIITIFWKFYGWVMMLLGDEIGKGGLPERLGELLGLFSELIMSGTILIVLKTKNLIVTRRTAILILITRIAFGGLLIYPFVLPLHVKSYICIFIFSSIFTVAFLSLRSMQYYAIAIFMLIIGITIGRSPIDYLSILLFDPNVGLLQAIT